MVLTSSPLGSEKIWFDKYIYDLAEKKYYENLSQNKAITKLSSSQELKHNLKAENVTATSASQQRKSESSCETNLKHCLENINILKISEKVWIDKYRYDLAEKEYYEKLTKQSRLQSVDKNPNKNQCKNEKSLGKTMKDSGDANNTVNDNDKSVHTIKSLPNDNKETQTVDTKLINEKMNKNIDIESEENNPESLVENKKLIETNKVNPTKLKEKEQNIKMNVEDAKNTVVNEKTHIDNPSKLPKGIKNTSGKHNNPNPSPPKNKSTNINNIPNFPPNGLTSSENNNNNNNKKDKTTNFITDKSLTNVKITDTTNPIINVKDNLINSNPDDSLTVKESKKSKKSKKRHRDEKKGVSQNTSWNSIAGEVAKARQHIKNSLQCIDDIASITSSNVVVEVNNRINALEKENSELKLKVKELTDLLSKFEDRLSSVENKTSPAKPSSATPSQSKSDDVDDGVDLFASDSEEENTEAAKIKEQRLAEYAAKKSKKPSVIAKSSIILDVKPWDDETDMKKMEKEVRKIKTDGLLWGASKLVPLAYGIHKLQINCVVEDEKVSIDWLQETIEEIEDYVQSVDIAAFNKI